MSVTKEGELPNVSPTQFYAVSQEQVRHFDLILRSGKEYTLPYSLLPVSVLEGETLKIIAYELHVHIKGRNLLKIRDYLKSETLLWLKESPSGKDDGASKVFISDIVARGKAVDEGEIN